jgi:branched-chain amino acid transport system permease protein
VSTSVDETLNARGPSRPPQGAFARHRWPTNRRDWIVRVILPVVLLIVLFTYPQYVNTLTSNTQWAPDLPTMVAIAVFVMMALGLNVVVGYAGLLDLGYVAFYASGAYFAGWFASQQFAQRDIHFGDVGVPASTSGIHISIWILCVGGALFATTLGVLIGLPTLRLRGDYLAIVTLGFGEIIPQIVRNGDNFFGSGFNLTNGPNGITPIDGMGFGSVIHAISLGLLPEDFAAQSNSDSWYYWVALVFVLLTLFCCIRLRDSRLGRAWVAIREDEIAAAAMGIPLMRTKTLAYAIGAFFGGWAGAFFAVYKGSTFPGDFFLQISVLILCMVILGGMGNVWGVCVGAALLAYLNYQGLAAVGNQVNSTFGTNIDVPQYEFLIFGIIIVVTMLLRPQGLIPSQRRKAELELGVEGGSLYDQSV